MTELKLLKLSQVTLDPNQPRKWFSVESLNQLKKSIQRYGIKNPLLVEEVEKGKYMLTDGERRYRAAKDLKLVEVPAIIEPKKNDTDRIIEQFHIQEQHESWTAVEKASVVLKLSKEMKISLAEMSDLLGITPRMAKRYVSFGDLINTDLFQEKQLNVEWADDIKHLKAFTKTVSLKYGNKDFSRSDQSRLEKVIINKIVSEEITSKGDFTKLKDSFRKEPKSIETFLEGRTSPTQLFVETKAKGAYHMRGSVNCALQLQNNLSAFMAISDVKVDPRELNLMKEIVRTVQKFVDRYE